MGSRRKPNTIPYAEAEQLWRTYRWSTPESVCLEDLAMALNVVVVDDSIQSAEARLVRKGNHGIIRVNRNLDPPTRRRFAIGHELGHWRLHKKISQLFVCLESDMIANYRKSRYEAEANYFASALLMPEKLFLDKSQTAQLSFNKLRSLASYFDTSLTATAIRWIDLAEDYSAVVFSKNNHVKWWHGSEDFEETFWINPGNRIPSNTAASTCKNSNSAPIRKRVAIDSWAEKKQLIYTNEFIEESMFFGKYDFTLTLLSLP